MPFLAESLSDRRSHPVSRFTDGAETGEQDVANRFGVEAFPTLHIEIDLVDRRIVYGGGFGNGLLG